MFFMQSGFRTLVYRGHILYNHRVKDDYGSLEFKDSVLLSGATLVLPRSTDSFSVQRCIAAGLIYDWLAVGIMKLTEDHKDLDVPLEVREGLVDFLDRCKASVKLLNGSSHFFLAKTGIITVEKITWSQETGLKADVSSAFAARGCTLHLSEDPAAEATAMVDALIQLDLSKEDLLKELKKIGLFKGESWVSVDDACGTVRKTAPMSRAYQTLGYFYHNVGPLFIEHRSKMSEETFNILDSLFNPESKRSKK